MSQITTHVLDTSTGQPAQGIKVTLEKPRGKSEWVQLADGITNADGRVSDLLPKSYTLEPGTFRLVFHTGPYFKTQKVKGFYPQVVIIFEVPNEEHYHVPVLLNPFGYSTYRGS